MTDADRRTDPTHGLEYTEYTCPRTGLRVRRFVGRRSVHPPVERLHAFRLRAEARRRERQTVYEPAIELCYAGLPSLNVDFDEIGGRG